MSGSTVTIERSRYNQVKQRSEEAARRRLASQLELEAARRKMQDVLRELERESGHNASDLKRVLQEEERKIKKDIDGVSRDLKREVHTANVEMRSEIKRIRKDLIETNREIDAVQEQIYEVTQRFDKQLQKIIDRIDGEKERAQFYLSELDDLMDVIQTLHPEKLTPGEYERLAEVRRFAQEDLEGGVFQSAIGLAQGAIVDAAELQARLERMNDEYSQLNVSIAESVVSVRKRICQLLEYPENESDIDIKIRDDEFTFHYDGDIEYWSDGMFQRLCGIFDDLEDRIRREFIENMDLANMRIAERDIPTYIDRFLVCENFAREEFSSSSHIQGTAIRLNNAITSNSTWMLMDSGFVGDDSRQPYQMTYVDRSENQTVLVIFSNETIRQIASEADASFSIESFDGEMTNKIGLCKVVRDDVVSRISSAGIDLGGVPISKQDDKHSDKPDTFVVQECRRLSKIRQGRKDAIRTQMRL